VLARVAGCCAVVVVVGVVVAAAGPAEVWRMVVFYSESEARGLGM